MVRVVPTGIKQLNFQAVTAVTFDRLPYHFFPIGPTSMIILPALGCVDICGQGFSKASRLVDC